MGCNRRSCARHSFDSVRSARSLRDIIADGRLLLFPGWEPLLDPRVMTHYRAAILRLKPRR